MSNNLTHDNNDNDGNRMIEGTPASKGVALGVAHLAGSTSVDALKRATESYETRSLNEEMERVWDAAERLAKKLDDLAEEHDSQGLHDAAALLTAESEMVTDSSLHDAIADFLDKGEATPVAIIDAAKRESEKLMASGEDYIKERAGDLISVGRLLAKELCGLNIEKNIIEEKNQTDFKQKIILVMDEPSTDEMLAAIQKRPAGIVIGKGSNSCHAAILARSLKIPALVQLGDGVNAIEEGVPLLVDADRGHVILAPTDEEIKSAENDALIEGKNAPPNNEATDKDADHADHSIIDPDFMDGDAMMTDDYPVRLRVNVSEAGEIAGAMTTGADGVGLYRSEFLFLGRDVLPDEDEQFESYKNAAISSAGRVCVIRVLDAGGDKPVKSLSDMHETNPALGNRGIRLLLAGESNKTILRTQLRAVLRASAYGKLAIMIPMVTSVTEIDAVKKIVAEIKSELSSKSIQFDNEIKVGAMIETPAAAMLADELAKHADFFSIGTNDLTQYTLAVDRMSYSASHLIDYLHPAVLRLIQFAVDGADEAGIYVSVCGEMAGDPIAAPVLAAMGVSSLSMDESKIRTIRDVLSSISLITAQDLLDHALGAATPDEYKKYADGVLKETNSL